MSLGALHFVPEARWRIPQDPNSTPWARVTVLQTARERTMKQESYDNITTDLTHKVDHILKQYQDLKSLALYPATTIHEARTHREDFEASHRHLHLEQERLDHQIADLLEANRRFDSQ